MAERIMMTDALPLVGHMNDLSEIDVGILRGGKLETLAAGDEHGPVRGECDALRIMRSAFDLWLLPPNRLETFQARRSLSEYQTRIADSCTAGSIRTGFGKAQIDALVAGKIGMRDNLSKTPLPLDMDSGNTRDLLLATGGDIEQPELAGLFSDQRHVGFGNPRARQKIQSPRRVETRDFRHSEGTLARRGGARRFRATGSKCDEKSCLH